MSPADPNLTADDIAEDLHCSKSHAQNLINGKVKALINGKKQNLPPIPHMPLGRLKVVKRSSFEAWKLQVEAYRISVHSEHAVGAIHQEKEMYRA